MKNKKIPDEHLARLERLIQAKRTGKHILIKRTERDASKAAWAMAKVTDVNSRDGIARIVVFEAVKIDRIAEVKFPGGGKGRP